MQQARGQPVNVRRLQAAEGWRRAAGLAALAYGHCGRCRLLPTLLSQARRGRALREPVPLGLRDILGDLSQRGEGGGGYETWPGVAALHSAGARVLQSAAKPRAPALAPLAFRPACFTHEKRGFQHRQRFPEQVPQRVLPERNTCSTTTPSPHATRTQACCARIDMRLACFTDRKFSRPKAPSSRPKPLALTPPQGACTKHGWLQFTHTMPASSASLTRLQAARGPKQKQGEQGPAGLGAASRAGSPASDGG